MRRIAVLSALALLPLAVAAPAAGGGGAGLHRVSGPSPVRGCAIPRVGGTNYPNAEVEPQVAVDPRNPAHLVGAWQQDRWSNGGANAVLAGRSFDGGRSWQRSPLPFNRCVRGGLPYDRASDPWVSIGPDGTVYAAGLSFDLSNKAPLGGAPNAITAAVSRDGGRSWRNVREIARDSGQRGHSTLDKGSITADPTRPGTAYAVWDLLYVSNSSATTPFTGPGYFAKTTDYGRTWSQPRVIAESGANQEAFGNVVLVEPRTQDLYDFYEHFHCTCVSVPQIRFVRSRDGGRTWSPPQQVVRDDSVGVVDPNNSDNYVRTLGLPSVAVDPGTGRFYVAYQSGRFSSYRYDEIALTSSADGGRTWTTPERVSPRTGRPAFIPTVAVLPNGTVGVSYYDVRRLQHGNRSTLPTDYWLRTSANGGRTFGAEQHLAGPFNTLAAPYAGGYLLGDYSGLTAGGGRFYAFFVATNCLGQCPANRTDIFATSAVPLPATVGEAADLASATPPVLGPAVRRPMSGPAMTGWGRR